MKKTESRTLDIASYAYCTRANQMIHQPTLSTLISTALESDEDIFEGNCGEMSNKQIW